MGLQGKSPGEESSQAGKAWRGHRDSPQGLTSIESLHQPHGRVRTSVLELPVQQDVEPLGLQARSAAGDFDGPREIQRAQQGELLPVDLVGVGVRGAQDVLNPAG